MHRVRGTHSKHNFTLLGDHEIFLEFRPGHIYNRIPELELVTWEKVPSKVMIFVKPQCLQYARGIDQGRNIWLTFPPTLLAFCYGPTYRPSTMRSCDTGRSFQVSFTSLSCLEAHCLPTPSREYSERLKDLTAKFCMFTRSVLDRKKSSWRVPAQRVFYNKEWSMGWTQSYCRKACMHKVVLIYPSMSGYTILDVPKTECRSH